MTEHPDADQWVALALADLDAAEQDRLIAHLADCPACQADYAETSADLEFALAATPSAAPPAGFSGRVLEAMGTSNPTPKQRRPATRLLIAAAVLVGLLGGIGGTIATYAALDRPPVTSTAVDPVAAPLITRTGETIGSIGLAERDGHSFLLLNVTSGKPGANYDCILIDHEGRRSSGGRWTLTSEYGSANATGSWLVPISAPPASVELVAPSGTVWSRASF